LTNADEVLRQIQGLHNWCVPEGTGLLTWPADALYGLWFGKAAPDDGFTAQMQKAFNVCLSSESAKTLQEEAGKLKDVMDGMKKKTAEDFARLMEAARKEPLVGEKFLGCMVSRNRVAHKSRSSFESNARDGIDAQRIPRI
jgi:hypothetical protein